jgi:hypothetical protein
MKLTLIRQDTTLEVDLTPGEAGELVRSVSPILPMLMDNLFTFWMMQEVEPRETEPEEPEEAGPEEPEEPADYLSPLDILPLHAYVRANLGLTEDAEVFWTTWKQNGPLRSLDLIEATLSAEAAAGVLVTADDAYVEAGAVYYTDAGLILAKASGTRTAPVVLSPDPACVTQPAPQPTTPQAQVETSDFVAAALWPEITGKAVTSAQDLYNARCAAAKIEPTINVPLHLTYLGDWINRWVYKRSDQVALLTELAQNASAVALCSYLGGLRGVLRGLLGENAASFPLDLGGAPIWVRDDGAGPGTWEDAVVAAVTTLGVLPMIPADVAAALRHPTA